MANTSMPAAVSKSSKANGYEVKAGNETVMFRYEKNFFHKTWLFVHVRDSKGSDATRARVAPVSAYAVYYVGMELSARRTTRGG